MSHKVNDLVVRVGQGRRVYASYHGGAYIDLSFGQPGRPTEVINVWNDEGNHAELVVKAGAGVRFVQNETSYVPFGQWQGFVRETVLDWAQSQDEEWPEWYEGYLENARW